MGRTKRKVAQIAVPIILLMQWMSLFSSPDINISVDDTVADLKTYRTTMEDSEVNDLMEALDQFRKAKDVLGNVFGKNDIDIDNPLGEIGNKPLALISHGCSESSPVIDFTRQVLEAHGIDLMTTKRAELLIPKKNPYVDSAIIHLRNAAPSRNSSSIPFKYGRPKHDNIAQQVSYDQVIVEAMDQITRAADAMNKTLFYKADEGRINTGMVLEGLEGIGTLFAHTYRANALDRLVCAIRDCFIDSPYAFPVFASNGTIAKDFCFKRRESNVKSRVYFANMPELIGFLRRFERGTEKAINKFRSLVGPSESQATEDLFAYEYTQDEEIFSQSRKAWINLLSFAIDDIKEDIVSGLMRKYQNSREPPGLHSSVIQNYHEVAAALRHANPSLDQYLRL